MSIFAPHGIPDEGVSDNGPQFASAEFNNFYKLWEFRHVTSSPEYSQSNGQIERTVQTVKKILKKADETGQDPYLSILEYRNSPLDSVMKSQAQLLMSRRLKTRLPITTSLLPPQVPSNAAKQLRS
jgi:transposase InsO family protein